MQSYDKFFLMNMLENMWTVRKFEETAADSFLKGEIKGNVHVCLGGEGAVVGAEMALEPTDYVAVSHRGHGHSVLKSQDADRAMAELFGREAGLCKGRGGSLLVTKIDTGLLGANGIVGGGIPIATGSALTSKINQDGAVTVAFFGDGASNQGTFHECLNMAASWQLPIIYFIENNGYAVSTNVTSATNTEDLAVRGKAYGIPGEVVDGTDVLAVYEATRRAAERARTGGGPTIIDCHIYRFTGHFVGDPAVYMPQSYRDEARATDAIEKFMKYLLDTGTADQAEIDDLERKVAEKIAAALAFAKASPLPQKDTVLDYNYSTDNERSVLR